ncbi:unnamed protein product [Linum tenue]|nr:unnamed protein product [Linum tenue]
MPTTVRNRLRVLDCNKDLVLCGFRDLARRMSDETSRSYLVCNPFSKQWIALPLAPRRYAHYDSPAARLVCEPRIELDLGDDDRSFVYSEHRFRVVCVYHQAHQVIKLDVFCSESGEWTKDALAFENWDRIGPRSVVSCNGELFFKYCAASHDANYIPNLVAVFNPFRLDTPVAFIDVSSPFPAESPWFISNSQGALHLIALAGSETLPTRASVWRLGEDRKSWRKQCEGLVNRTSMYCRHEDEGCFEPFLHPHKPERVFFSRVADEYEISYLRNKHGPRNALMCCDLGREEEEEEEAAAPALFARLKRKSDIHHLQVFVPRVSCWPTPIPQLQGGGSSSEAAAECPSLHILRNW